MRITSYCRIAETRDSGYRIASTASYFPGLAVQLLCLFLILLTDFPTIIRVHVYYVEQKSSKKSALCQSQNIDAVDGSRCRQWPVPSYVFPPSELYDVAKLAKTAVIFSNGNILSLCFRSRYCKTTGSGWGIVKIVPMVSRTGLRSVDQTVRPKSELCSHRDIDAMARFRWWQWCIPFVFRPVELYDVGKVAEKQLQQQLMLASGIAELRIYTVV